MLSYSYISAYEHYEYKINFYKKLINLFAFHTISTFWIHTRTYKVLYSYEYVSVFYLFQNLAFISLYCVSEYFLWWSCWRSSSCGWPAIVILQKMRLAAAYEVTLLPVCHTFRFPSAAALQISCNAAYSPSPAIRGEISNRLTRAISDPTICPISPRASLATPQNTDALRRLEKGRELHGMRYAMCTALNTPQREHFGICTLGAICHSLWNLYFKAISMNQT